MSDFYPYLNRGAYKWIPDDYAATTADNFGVLDAYNFAVCNHGRHVNVLAGAEAGMAFGTTVVCRGIRDQSGNRIFQNNNTYIFKPFDANVPDPIMDIFRSTIRRSTSTNLITDIPIPVQGSGIGFSYEDLSIDPFFFFSTTNLSGPNNSNLAILSSMGRIASLDVNYMLATSELWENANSNGVLIHSRTNPPLAIMAILDQNLIDSNSTWWEATRGISENTEWGPAKEQIAVDPHTKSACLAIQTAIGSGELTAVFLPMYIYSDGAVNTYAELEITSPGAYPGENPDWSILSRNEDKNIKLSGRYWTSLEYFPEIAGFLIMPNWRSFKGDFPKNPQSTSSPSAKDNAWNAVISGLRVYDALQANTTPEHLETTTQIIGGKEVQTTKEVESQLPCEIFGYAWRINHPVAMSTYTLSVQPSRGTLLSNNPGFGLGDRKSTFYFKIYHPKIPGLGVAHGVRFYYGLAVVAIPGTNIYAMGSFSVAGVLSGLAADADLLLVQYISVVLGTQSLTFQFGYNQYGEVGKVAYSGDFAYSKETVAVRCGYLKKNVTSAPQPLLGSMTWLSNSSAVPSSDRNGTRVLYYDNDPEDAEIKWYGFASINSFGVSGFDPDTFGANYVGGITPLIKGAPQTNLPGPGAFGMGVSSFSSFIGNEKLTVYNKPKQYGFSAPEIDAICSDNNNHLATFVSEVRNIGPDVQMYGGTWRLRLAASTDSTANLNSQIFFRFAFIPEKYNGETIDLSTINASSLWNIPHYEFYFKRIGGNYHIYHGKPSFADVIATPVLTENEIVYNLGWDVYFGSGENVVDLVPEGSAGSGDADAMLNKKITLLLSNVMPGMEGIRLVVQAWSASFSIDNRYANSSNVFDPLKLPTVKLSWSGETESYFQTMILETKSDTIFAQQDPFVFGNNVESYDFITFSPCDQSKESKIAIEEEEKKRKRAEETGEPYTRPLYRCYPLWENTLSFINGQLTSANGGAGGYSKILAKANFGKLTTSENYIANSGRVSLVNFAIPEILDLIEEKAQIADIAILSDIGGSVVGGTTIGPLKLDVDFAYTLNASNFSLKYTIELLAVPYNGATTYLIGRSGLQTIDSSTNPDSTQQFSGRASFNIFVNSPILVPDPEAMLMLRFKIWPKSNGTNPTSIQNNIITNFASIDIDDFRMKVNSIDETTRKTIDVITSAQFVRGSSEWYEDLNITTSRTFGSQDYYFVPDANTRNTTIMPPLTTSGYGYWYLEGWIFSPFWYLQMPEGACIEIKDDAGLTAGNATIGSGFTARERAQRVLMFRTAVGTIPAASVSSDLRSYKNAGGKGVIAKQRIEVSGATTATNFISIAHQVQNSDALSRNIGESLVKIGENIISGKNPLIITGSPGNNVAAKLYSGNPSTAYLFYEEDSFDIDTHSSIVMLANYDGTMINWSNPYGKRSSGGTNKVVVNTDMRLIGASVDLFGYGIYIAGYRANSLTNPSAGGTIVLKKINPGLVFGTESAHVGPLHIVDGKVTPETYNVSSFGDVQPVLPIDMAKPHLNTLSSSGDPLPAAESFPDVVCDPRGYIYVFYSLLATDAQEAKNVLGKVFCRESHNAGYWFDKPFPIVDLGYEKFLLTLGGTASADDTSFQAKHITCIYNNENSTYCIFFWANGKIFMRMTHHPQIDFNNYKVLISADNVKKAKEYYDAISSIYMIEGDTSFTDDVINSNLDIWLKTQWDLGEQMKDEDLNSQWVGQYSSATSEDISGKSNNFKTKYNEQKNKTEGAFIKILKYSNSLDVPPQRIGAVINEKGDILVFYLNNIGNLVYKKVTLFGNGPTITPAVTVSLSEI